MSTDIGIDLRVDASQARDAKQALLDTTKALDDLARHGGAEIDLKGDAFAEMARQMNETMRKLEGLNSRISATGGQKSIAQEQEAARLMQKQKTDADAYEKILGKIGSQLDTLYERKKKLERTPYVAGSDEQIRAKDELDKITKELDAKTSLYEKIQGRYDPRVDRALRRSSAAAEEIAGYDTLHDEGAGGGGASMWAWGKRGLLVAGALLGYRGLLAPTMDAKEEARQMGIANTDLSMRGGGFLNRELAALFARDTGYKANEQMAIIDTLNRSTGLREPDLFNFSHMMMREGRLSGVGGEAMANYVAQTFPAVSWGKANEKYDGVMNPYNATYTAIKMLRDSAVALSAGGRLHEVLDTNAKLLTDIVGRRSGKELTMLDQEQMTMMQMSLWAAGKMGQGASGVNIIETLDQGIRNGGSSPGMQALIFQALGGEGVKSRRDLWDLQMRQSEGASIRNVVDVMDASIRFSNVRGVSADDAKIAAMQNLMGLPGVTPQMAEFLMGDKPESQLLRQRLHTLRDKGGVGKVYEEILNTPTGKTLLAETNATRGEYDRSPGAKSRAAEAELSTSMLDLGGKVQELTNVAKTLIARGLENAQKDPMTPHNPMIPSHLPVIPRFNVRTGKRAQ